MARSESREQPPALITAAPQPRSLDVETRQRRYLISMAVRTVLFLAAFFVPGLWGKLACIAAAAFIPSVAVLLANNADNHKLPPPAADDDDRRPALTSGPVIRGSVVDDEPARDE